MIRQQHATNDVDTSLAADLKADVSHPKPDIAGQRLVAILRRPDNVVAVIENAVAAGLVLHVLTLWKMSRSPVEGSFSRG